MGNSDYPQERRKFLRASFPCRIIVHSPKTRVLDSSTENISVGGVRVILKERLEALTIVGLEVYLIKEPVVCKGRIVWVVDAGGGLSDTGIEFYEIRESDQRFVAGFVERLVKSGG